MAKNEKNLPAKPVDRLKGILAQDSVKQQFENALKDNAPLFVASLIDIYGGDSNLQKCEPGPVVMEALKAATLKLPINKSLGFAYIIPYGNDPQFQIGYKGYIQLAIRTGQYKYINADYVYEGEEVEYDRITGEMFILGEKKSDKVIGYFAFFETLNGFRKAICWTKEIMTAHAKKYSKSFNRKSSPWKTEFDKMGLKTMLRALLGKYGVMSVDMATAFESDSKDMDPAGAANREADQNANQEPIDITPKADKRKKKAAPKKEPEKEPSGMADAGAEPPSDVETGDDVPY